MKKVLTVILCYGANRLETIPENCEVIEAGENEDVKTALKRAVGKYTLVVWRTLLKCDFNALLQELQTCEADVAAFGGGFCFKTQFLKGVRKFDGGSAQIFALLACKSISKINSKPFVYTNDNNSSLEDEQKKLNAVADEFGREKAKLNRDVYQLTFDALIYFIIRFYAAAALGIRKKAFSAESMVAFDSALKENIVLYLALEKRFTIASLSKLRKSNFEISYFTANKFKRFLNKNG